MKTLCSRLRLEVTCGFYHITKSASIINRGVSCGGLYSTNFGDRVVITIVFSATCNVTSSTNKTYLSGGDVQIKSRDVLL